MTDDILGYDWSRTFEDLTYQAKLRNIGDTEFGTCLKCLEKGIPSFNKVDMIEQAKPYGITVKFTLCEKHDGVTK